MTITYLLVSIRPYKQMIMPQHTECCTNEEVTNKQLWQPNDNRKMIRRYANSKQK